MLNYCYIGKMSKWMRHLESNNEKKIDKFIEAQMMSAKD